MEVAAAGEVVDRFFEALEDWAESLSAGEAFDEFVSDVSGFEIGENENVGVALDLGFGAFLGGDGRDKGGVDLDFAVDDEVWLEFSGYLKGLADFFAVFFFAECGEREEGDFWFDAEFLGGLGAVDGNMGEFFGSWVDVDGAIGEEKEAFFENHHEEAGDFVEFFAGAKDFEGGANGAGSGDFDAGNEAVGVILRDEHGAEIIDVFDGLFGFFFGDAFVFA